MEDAEKDRVLQRFAKIATTLFQPLPRCPYRRETLDLAVEPFFIFDDFVLGSFEGGGGCTMSFF